MLRPRKRPSPATSTVGGVFRRSPREPGGAHELSKKDKQDSEPASIIACQDNEIEPLSGKPSFHSLLQKSHVNSSAQLVIPAKFTKILPPQTVTVILTCGSKKWETKYLGDNPTHKRFECTTWKTFAVDNRLKVGDVCVFELMETGRPVKFKVQILRGEFPSILLESIEGSKDRPVIID